MDIENLQCTNYHLDTCKYSRKLRKCYKVNCYRIHLKGTMRTRSPQVQKHALSRPQTNQFHNPYRPANSAFENKSHKTTHSFNPHNSTRPDISSYTYSQNPIIPYSHSLTSSYPHPNSQQPSSQRHNHSRHAHCRTITLPPSTILPPERVANCKNRTEHR